MLRKLLIDIIIKENIYVKQRSHLKYIFLENQEHYGIKILIRKIFIVPSVDNYYRNDIKVRKKI